MSNYYSNLDKKALDMLAKDYLEVDEQIKKLSKQKETLRQTILEVAEKHWNKNEHERPITHVHFPKEFGGTKEDIEKHLQDNFVTWEITDLFEEDGGFSAFLKKKSEYVPYRFENEYVIDKSPTQATPEINWESLEKEDFELAQDIKETVVVRKVNSKKFNKYILENPEGLAKINRHIIENKPSQRIIISKNKEIE